MLPGAMFRAPRRVYGWWGGSDRHPRTKCGYDGEITQEITQKIGSMDKEGKFLQFWEVEDSPKLEVK